MSTESKDSKGETINLELNGIKNMVEDIHKLIDTIKEANTTELGKGIMLASKIKIIYSFCKRNQNTQILEDLLRYTKTIQKHANNPQAIKNTLIQLNSFLDQTIQESFILPEISQGINQEITNEITKVSAKITHQPINEDNESIEYIPGELDLMLQVAEELGGGGVRTNLNMGIKSNFKPGEISKEKYYQKPLIPALAEMAENNEKLNTLEKQYNAILETYLYLNIIEKTNNGRYQYTSEINNKSYLMPTLVEISKRLNENPTLKTKIEEGFTRLILVPFGISLLEITEVFLKRIKEHQSKDALYSDTPINGQKGDKIPSEKNKINIVFETDNNGDRTGDILYYPEGIGINESYIKGGKSKEKQKFEDYVGGKTKQDVLSLSEAPENKEESPLNFPGWNVFLMPENLYFKYIGRRSYERSTQRVYRWPEIYKEENESYLTIEDIIYIGLLKLEQQGQLIKSMQMWRPKGGISKDYLIIPNSIAKVNIINNCHNPGEQHAYSSFHFYTNDKNRHYNTEPLFLFNRGGNYTYTGKYIPIAKI